MRKYILDGMNEKAGNNISWRSIFAGVVTFVALSILFSLIGTAIGFGVPDFTSSNPLDGVGTGLIIWLIVALIISLAAAGYIAGLTANRAGFIHGFLTWAVSIVVMFWLMTSALSMAFGALGNVLGFTGQVVGDTVGVTVDTVASLSQDAFDAIANQVNVDTDELQQSVTDVLEETDIEQLQPDYLENQMQATVDDITNAGYAVVVEGQDPQQAIDEVVSNIQGRIDEIGQELDEEALTEAVAANTDLTEAEAQAAVENIQQAYADATEQATQVMEEAQTAIADLQVQAQQAVDEAAVVAEDVSNETSKYSLYIFIGLLLAMFITAFAGYAGTKTAVETHNNAV
ncbi:hypothetical protein [Fundicoccus culcitae]|uniref:Uncharacterized protein n=1 Tax=Fundicoccus culcitae TaxID=2969821 RepID=A0ABY5P210_9LACT|nr:hypothetical protein [Fundicoccus culcitae]UUX32739.1 hypothetical protein NRE15_07355 [Fundicoccus culcitae]